MVWEFGVETLAFALALIKCCWVAKRKRNSFTKEPLYLTRKCKYFYMQTSLDFLIIDLNEKWIVVLQVYFYYSYSVLKSVTTKDCDNLYGMDQKTTFRWTYYTFRSYLHDPFRIYIEECENYFPPFRKSSNTNIHFIEFFRIKQQHQIVTSNSKILLQFEEHIFCKQEIQLRTS